MRYIYLYIIVFLQVCFTQLKATTTDSLTLNYPYINYTTKDGLPSNETYCVLQDSRGYIWIGTDRGLVKYDGYTFKTYTTLDGLTDNVILAIKEDRHGNLWYTGLNNTQLGYIDSNMIFHKYEHYETLLDSIANKERHQLAKTFLNIHFNEIYFKGDDIYLVNNRFGYVIVNQQEIKKVQLDFKERSTISNCLIDGDLQFIYSNKSLLYIEKLKNDITVNGKYISTYLKGNSETIFPSLLVKDNVKYIYDGKDYIVITSDTCIHKNSSYSISAYEINENLYVFSLYDHLEESDIIYISKSPNLNDKKEQLFSGERTSSGVMDRNGGIWISTLRSGVIYFPGLESKNIRLDIPVEYMYSEKKGMVLGKRGRKYIFRQSYIRSIDYYKLSKFKDITSTNMRFSNSTYIHFYDPKSQAKNKFLRFVKGFQVLSDSLEYIYGFGHIYRIENSVIHRIYPTLKDVYGKINIESLYGFNADSCLLGTRSGLYSFSNGELKQLEYSKNKRIKDLAYIPEYDVLIYVVWGEGIRIRFSSGELIKITEEEGLVSNIVNQLVVDDNDELWIATNRGLNKLIFRDENKIPEIETVLKSSKILSSPNILQLIVEDSTLYLGTDSGFDVIDITTLYESKSKSMSLFIDDILINKISQQDGTSDFNLEYDENNITIHYTSIAFNQFGNIEYRYRLEGLSDEWVYTKQRLASFLQLNPGEYTFILEVQDDHGDWITLEDTPHFIIQTPYWKTGWFIGGVSLVILIIGGGALYYYISNLKKEKAFIEDKQQLSESLNESRQKALSAQLNPHFVFNSLNSIQNFILTRRTELSSDYLSMFSKLMRYVFENSKSLYVVLTDEIEALRLYLELEQVRHNHKFQYEIQHNNIDTQEAKLPALLIQPIIENAIWHGLLHKKEDDRKLEVVFSKENQSLKIEVIDNGVGRHKVKPKQKFIKKQRSSGVELTKQRLELLGQSTNSKTSFKIIDLFNEEGSPGGTQVIITIPLIKE